MKFSYLCITTTCYNWRNDVNFITWFNVAAHPFCGDRWENRWRSVFQVTKSIASVTEVSTVTAGNAETTANFTGTGYLFNVMARKIAIQLPFDCVTVPILTVGRLMLHNDQNGAKHKFGNSGKILEYIINQIEIFKLKFGISRLREILP